MNKCNNNNNNKIIKIKTKKKEKRKVKGIKKLIKMVMEAIILIIS